MLESAIIQHETSYVHVRCREWSSMTDQSRHRERYTTKTNADIRQTLCSKNTLRLVVSIIKNYVSTHENGIIRTLIANSYGCTRAQVNGEVSIGVVLACFVACGALAGADPCLHRQQTCAKKYRPLRTCFPGLIQRIQFDLGRQHIKHRIKHRIRNSNDFNFGSHPFLNGLSNITTHTCNPASLIITMGKFKVLIYLLRKPNDSSKKRTVKDNQTMQTFCQSPHL